MAMARVGSRAGTPARAGRDALRRRMRRNIALALATSLCALLAVEVALRAASFSEIVGRERIGTWRWTRYDPVLGHGNVPGFRLAQPEVTIDALGFRGPEVTVTKPAGVVRVVCLGDSTTFGIWLDRPGVIRADAPYPAEIARLAHADGLRVEVINGGVLGQSSSEALVELLTQVVPLHPDVVTVRLGNNDHGRALPGDVTPLATPLATRWEYPVVHAAPAFVWRSETVRLVFHAYRQYIARRRVWPSPRRVPAEQFEQNLRRFAAIARERGINLAFVDFPYREIARGTSPGEAFPNPMQAVTSLEELHAVHDEYQAIVARVADETGTPLVRTEPALRTAPGPTFGDYDLSHPNAVGYRVIARRIYDELRDRDWLGTPETGR